MSVETSETLTSSGQEPLPKKKNIIVCWDFDWSLVNQNSDYYVHEKLFGKDEAKSVHLKLRAKAASEGVTVFTDFMDQYGWPHMFNQFNLNPNSFADQVSDLPIFKENLQILNTINKYANANSNGTSSVNINQYIISNANSVLIDIILKKNNLHGNVFKWDQIFTNPGWFDKTTGILRCQRYHNVDDVFNCHQCDLCAVNLCKGKVLKEEVLPRHDQSFRYENTIIYIGDGGNDFCPVRTLGESDYAFVRQFDECQGLEKKVEADKDKVKCNVMKWKDGKALLNNFRQVLSEFDF
eukprot:841043_1